MKSSRNEVSIAQYEAATRSRKLDFSEHLILSLGLLQKYSNANPDIESRIEEIRKLYLETKYEEALYQLNILVVYHRPIIGSDVSKLLVDSSKQLKEVNVHDNYVRRFFENKLAETYFKDAMDLNVISNVFTGLPGSEVPHDRDHVKDEISEYIEGQFSPEVWRVYDDLIQYNNLYYTKDRAPKAGYEKKENGGYAESIYSQNTGVMKSIQPNFVDEILDTVQRNRVVDRSTTDNSRDGFSTNNPRGAFVASVSGHTYFMVAIMAFYMADEVAKGVPAKDIQTNVNEFVKAFVAAYVAKGFHGYTEMMDVLKQDHIKRVFSYYGVDLDLNWPNNSLKQACESTQEYAKEIILKAAMHQELKAKFGIEPEAGNNVAPPQPLAASSPDNTGASYIPVDNTGPSYRDMPPPPPYDAPPPPPPPYDAPPPPPPPYDAPPPPYEASSPADDEPPPYEASLPTDDAPPPSYEQYKEQESQASEPPLPPDDDYLAENEHRISEESSDEPSADDDYLAENEHTLEKESSDQPSPDDADYLAENEHILKEESNDQQNDQLVNQSTYEAPTSTLSSNEEVTKNHDKPPITPTQQRAESGSVQNTSSGSKEKTTKS